MDWIRKNWLNLLLTLIAAIGGADVAAGLKQDKSLTNLTVIPSVLAAVGSVATIGIRWLNSRTVSAKRIRAGLPPEFVERIENLFVVASDPDVTEQHAKHLADMAGDLLLAQFRRAQMAQQAGKVKVIPVSPGPDGSQDLSKMVENMQQMNAKLQELVKSD